MNTTQTSHTPSTLDRSALTHLLRTTRLDYTRNPVNLLFLVLVPVVFVLVAADTLTDAAELIGAGRTAPVHSASAGWAAGFLAGLATYFHVSANRSADRRLLLAGLPVGRLTLARMTSGIAVAVTVSAVAIFALAIRGDLTRPTVVAAGTLMSALIYVGIGAVVATALRDPLNGSIALLFIWIVDVFFGPVLGSGQSPVWRLLPTHFASLWTSNLPSGHQGRVGDLGWSFLWVTVSLIAAFLAVRTAGPHPGRTFLRHAPATSPGARDSERGPHPPSRLAGFRLQAGAMNVAGLRQLGRMPALWVLLAGVPAVFILLAEATTPHAMATISVTEHGRSARVVVDLADIHGGTMAPIAVASLAMLAGLFQGLDARSADRRLVIAGYRWPALAAARGVIALATAAVAVVASLVTAALVFDPNNWTAYVIGNALLAATYVLLGLVVGPVAGRVGGTFLAFLVPFLDVGLAQSPMLHEIPPGWARALAGYGPSRVLLDGALTDTFDEWRSLLVAGLWLLALLTVAAALSTRRLARQSAPVH